jgi:hypothetical protein
MSRMNVVRRLVSLFLFLAILLMEWGPASAQAATIQYFPETGHHVRGDFLRFYKSARDPLLVFGYPITEQLTSRDGKIVQYFQRARFELRDQLPESQRVQLTPVGGVLYQSGDQLRLSNTSGCELFPTGYPVCLAFLDFYKANGRVP